jgi:hypothetical protein
MTYVFTGTPADVLAAVARNAGAAAQDRLGADAHLRDALVGLVGVHLQEAEFGPVDAATLSRFRRESGAAFARVPAGMFGAFVMTVNDLAESGTEGEWGELSMRRSALQSLVDDYAGTPAAELLDANELAELDEEIRTAAPRHRPIPPRFVPQGLPESHWWWWAPGRPLR